MSKSDVKTIFLSVVASVIAGAILYYVKEEVL